MLRTADRQPNAASGDVLNLMHIADPYLLVVNQQLLIYQDISGKFFADDLWQKDLSMHLEYLDQLMLATVRLHQDPPPEAVPLNAKASTLEIIELPAQTSLLRALIAMPIIVFHLWRAIRRAAVVHSGIAGWPIPMGWIVTPLVLLSRKPYVIIVESAFWRLHPGVAVGWKRRLSASLHEFLGRWAVRNADLSIFTQDEYRASMLGPNASRGHVIPASWIDEKDILTRAEAEQIWEKKLAAPYSLLKILFVGRIIPDKGVLVLLEAMRRLSAENVPITLNFLGDGALKSECMAASSELTGVTSVRVLGKVPFGALVFSVIREHDAVVVPSISDEQPRNVYEAYSQGVPVLGSDTAGLRSCVRDGATGHLVPPNDVGALVALLKYASQHRRELKQYGLQALEFAHAMTHQEMHRQRAILLQAMLGARKESSRQSSIR
jgi:glycosyltransferase involved in cell wall biosynthesis